MSDIVRVVGIDPSLRRTGLARIVVDLNDHGRYPCGLLGYADTDVRASTGHRGDTVTQRRERLDSIARDVVEWSTPTDLVVIEGPSYGSSVSAAAWDRAGLWWQIVSRLARRDVPVAVVPPRTRARWITGNGNADKQAVLAAVEQLWTPAGWTGDHADDNEGDALVLASMGAQWLGALPVQPQPQRAPLDRCEWPYLEKTI